MKYILAAAVLALAACGGPTEPSFVGTEDGASSSAAFAKGKTGLGGLARSLEHYRKTMPDQTPGSRR
jgi:hypothetical protein